MSHSRTIISLPHGHSQAQARPGQVSESLRDRNAIPLQGRMIAGILYSVSRNLMGEIFPVYIGKNTIGSAPDCDICLRESSVCESHAILLVRKLTDQNGRIHTTVSISEDTPGAGTSVNGEPLEYDRIHCKSGDLIAIGPNYRLSLQMLSPETHGVTVCPDFDPLPAVETRTAAAFEIGPDPVSMMYGSAASYRDTIGEDDERAFYAPSKAREKDHVASQTIVENSQSNSPETNV